MCSLLKLEVAQGKSGDGMILPNLKPNIEEPSFVSLGRMEGAKISKRSVELDAVNFIACKVTKAGDGLINGRVWYFPWKCICLGSVICMFRSNLTSLLHLLCSSHLNIGRCHGDVDDNKEYTREVHREVISLLDLQSTLLSNAITHTITAW